MFGGWTLSYAEAIALGALFDYPTHGTEATARFWWLLLLLIVSCSQRQRKWHIKASGQR